LVSQQKQVTWVGNKVGEYIIEEVLGGGRFSRVYAGTREGGRTRKVFKVARPVDLLGPSDTDTDCLPTKAVLQMTGAIAELIPDTDELIRKQAEKLRSIQAKAMPEVDEIFSERDLSWYRMPFIAGETLRKRMTLRQPVTVDDAMDIINKLHRLSADPKFQYHGDLKPENVMMTESGVVLLDPGHFGPLRTKEGSVENMAVTTPAYYPTLMADDLFALGLMFMEIACGKQPLSETAYAETFDNSRIHADLFRLVRAEEVTGKAYFSPILGVRPLSECFPNIMPDYDRFLLKALRLEVRNDMLAVGEGFRSFSAMSGALIQLKSKGLMVMNVGY
jgi:serine/threonine protein kinase